MCVCCTVTIDTVYMYMYTVAFRNVLNIVCVIKIELTWCYRFAIQLNVHVYIWSHALCVCVYFLFQCIILTSFLSSFLLLVLFSFSVQIKESSPVPTYVDVNEIKNRKVSSQRLHVAITRAC